MAYTTADLLKSIKRRGMIPTGQSTFQDADFLEMATEELQIELMPLLIGVREEYYVRHVDVALVSTQQAYPLPHRAVGAGLMDVLFLDGAGSPIEADVSYYLEGRNVMVDPAKTSAAYIRMLYYCRPGNLVVTTDAARITVIDTTTKVVTCSAVPAAWTTATKLDFVKAEGGQDYLDIDKFSTNITGSDVTFSVLPDDLAVGDYLTVAGTSPLPQVPVELQPVLAQKVVCQALESLGDQNGLGAAQARLKSLLENSVKLVSPRVKGGAKKLVSPSYF